MTSTLCHPATHLAALLVVAAVLVGMDGVGSAAIEIDQPTDPREQDAIDFNRHIRPILSNNCFQCHGPDSAARKMGLRLDTREGATAALRSWGSAIVPGDAHASVLMQRVSSPDEAVRMPPPLTGKRLTTDEIELLRRWINEGARWQRHWSYVPPQRPTPPTDSIGWGRNPIDSFILSRLQSHGLAPSPEAARETLIRRLSLDLTGLPPEPAEIDAFVADKSPDGYESLVDRLLGSPRYGEHMARFWLDAGRYGDTHGLHLDNERLIWRWRDWVIHAFNDNMPFDQFTIEQLAGDLLPEPTLEQRIATGFNRNNVTTSEGGAINEEYLFKYAVDRVETTATVWMGMTAGCAVCHDHKFDPLTQKDFYRLYAFFNNVAENAMDGNAKDPPPIIRAPTSDQKEALETIQAKVAEVTTLLEAPMPEVDRAQEQWESEWRDRLAKRWSVLDPHEFTSTGGSTLRKLEDSSLLAEGENPAQDIYEIAAHTDLVEMGIIQLEALTHETLPFKGPGRAENANLVLSEFEAEAISVVDPTLRQDIHFVRAIADHSQANGPYWIEYAVDGIVDLDNGWAVEGFARRENRTAMFVADEPFGFEGGTELRVKLRFESRFAQHAIGRVRLAVTTEQELYSELLPNESGSWWTVGPFADDSFAEAFQTAYGPEADPSSIDVEASYGEEQLAWLEQPEFKDGELASLKGANSATYAYRRITSRHDRSMPLSLGSDDGIRVWVNGELLLDKQVSRGAAPDQERIRVPLRAGDNHILLKIVNGGGPTGFYYSEVTERTGSELLQMTAMLASSEEAQSAQESETLRRYFRRNRSPEARLLYDELAAREKEENDFLATVPVSMVMQERGERRVATIMIRGEYDHPGDEVTAGVPGFLPELASDHPTRLDLAHWLVDGSNPLTSRVTVNRFWQQVFGSGLVTSSEDFGAQGKWPSHPDLLDWLAVEFVENGWDVKGLMREMVTSATYRQTSILSPDSHTMDPDNRLLSRGPRYRLDAEVIRDQALAMGGLLVEHVGGPSVKPYQPDGLWQAVGYPSSTTARFQADTGDAQHRRSLYTFWKRTSPPPNLTTFDAPSRETCTVQRPRTNTPLQALVLMNDPQFVEASRAFAQRVMREGGASQADQINFAFRLATGRLPTADEAATLVALLDFQRDVYRHDPHAATALVAIGESIADPDLDPVALAAWTTLTNVLLGLDEVVTKG